MLLLTQEYPPHVLGGLGTHVAELATGLARAGASVDVVLTTVFGEPPPPEERVTDNVRVHFAPVVGRSRVNDAVACARSAIERAGRPPDIVHCHDMFFAPAAAQLRRSHGVSVIGTAHLLMGPLYAILGEAPAPGRAQFESLFCKGCDRLITVSQSMSELTQRAYGIAADSIDVVHNAFDVDAFVGEPPSDAARSALREELGLSNDDRVVLFAGRLCRQKGIEALLSSAQRVVAQRSDVRYVVVGDVVPDWEEDFARLLERFSAIASHLRLRAKVPRDRLALYYAIADIAVVPSVYEPFGYAATEAMAAGVPLVATRTGGIPEIVSHGETGLLVPVTPGEPWRVDVEALADAQLALLADPERARGLAERARRHVCSAFTVDRMVAQTLDVYRTALARRGR